MNTIEIYHKNLCKVAPVQVAIMAALMLTGKLFDDGDVLRHAGIALALLAHDVAQPRLRLAQGQVREGVTLRNTGQRPALETVQIYVRDLVSSVTWAVKELKAYRQVRVQPGEQVQVDLELPVAACSLVNAKGQRVVEAGEFDLLVGRSSRGRDLMAVRFSVLE